MIKASQHELATPLMLEIYVRYFFNQLCIEQ